MVEPLAPSDPRRIGPYRIEGRLGAGGMGQVFLGSSAAGRKVALKVIRPELAATAQFRARFAREVEAARRVGGFHTAQVVDADPEAASPWLAAEYIPGLTLQQVVTAHGPLAPDAVLRLGAGIAEGLAAVHKCGLVHRDLKPGNVILADDGPRIIDFGIAHALDAGPMTHTGTIIGTYAYMSPEQIRAPARVTPASDVFSLGSVLAFAATGRGPFDASTVPAIVHRITSEAPVLTGIAEGGPLHTLVRHCLTKDPAGRPPTSEVLNRLAVTAPAVPPVPALPPRPATAPVDDRPIRRRSVLFGGLAAATAAVAVPAAVMLWPEGEPSAEPKDKPKASKSPDRDITKPVGELKGHENDIESMAVSRDGKFLATGGYDKTLKLWDLTAGREKATCEGHTDAVISVAFGADGATVYSGAFKELLAWDANSGAAKKKLAAYDSEFDYVSSLAMSPDGKTLAVGVGSRVELMDPDLGRVRETLEGHTGSMYCVAFSPDGRTLASVAADVGKSGVRLWDTADGRSLRTLRDGGDRNYSGVAFSPDGKTLIANGPGIQLWDVASGKLARTLTDQHRYLGSAAYRPAGASGKAMVVGGGGFVEITKTDTVGRTVSVWDADSGKLTATLVVGDPKRPLRASISRLAFTPDGRTLAGVFRPAPGENTFKPSVQLWKLP
ncbi:serine/threonine protein kinase [Streptomyces roseoverticillatus]|uniref:WD40 repeat domain-containing serine/threonine protein kinase n=1 Tax=Streptomyces roseoverticillatus TaxID=66429 RepID=UPI001F30AACA|nr:serine/threonine-protein kinase [Streptomyces roseoverticillatus]MCF3106715.1 serine/threonine protein kinase [Streptomyces roseoverticillatus]